MSGLARRLALLVAGSLLVLVAAPPSAWAVGPSDYCSTRQFDPNSVEGQAHGPGQASDSDVTHTYTATGEVKQAPAERVTR